MDLGKSYGNHVVMPPEGYIVGNDTRGNPPLEECAKNRQAFCIIIRASWVFRGYPTFRSEGETESQSRTPDFFTSGNREPKVRSPGGVLFAVRMSNQPVTLM